MQVLNYLWLHDYDDYRLYVVMETWAEYNEDGNQQC